MDIGKSSDNFKDGKPKCFNYNKYKHMAKEYWKKKEKETQKCFKIQQRRAHSQGLQRKVINEETKDSKGIR